MASKAKPLNDELKKQFLPLVKERGFVKQKSTDPHFSEFRRKTDNGDDVFEIQWDKYWRPYFVLNFEKQGTDDPRWKYKGRLQRKRGSSMSCWFSLKPPLLLRLIQLRWQNNPQEVIGELINAFDELEQWWQNGEAGPHIYIWELHA